MIKIIAVTIYAFFEEVITTDQARQIHGALIKRWFGWVGYLAGGICLTGDHH